MITDQSKEVEEQKTPVSLNDLEKKEEINISNEDLKAVNPELTEDKEQNLTKRQKHRNKKSANIKSEIEGPKLDSISIKPVTNTKDPRKGVLNNND